MAQQNTNGKRKSTIKKVWHYLKNYRFLLILSILMAALTVARYIICTNPCRRCD